MTNHRPRRLLSALTALAAIYAVSACGPAQVGTAAIVDGDAITVHQLQDDTQAYVSLLPATDKGVAQLRILEGKILSRVIDRAAATAGVSVSDGAVAAQRARDLSQVGGSRDKLIETLGQQQQVVPPAGIGRWVKDRLLFAQIAAKVANGGDPSSQAASAAAGEALRKAAASMKIRVNPRYGVWDPTRGVQALTSGGLSRTAAQLKASAAGR